jgi:hypothetical protein
VVAEGGAVSKIHGTPKPRVGWQAHEHRIYSSYTSEMYEPHIHTFSPYVSRDYDDQQNSQPVNAQKRRVGVREQGFVVIHQG